MQEHLTLNDIRGYGIRTADECIFKTADIYKEINDGMPENQYYITVHLKNKTEFSGNGMAVIQPESCELKQEENGVFEIEMTYPIFGDDTRYRYLDSFNILKVPIRYHDQIKYQLFRIITITNGGTSIVARHISYGNGADVMRGLTASAEKACGRKCGFDLNSDIKDVKNYACEKQKTFMGALLDGTDSFIGIFGGYLYRDNFHLSINEKTENSRDSGVIRYSRNMIDIDCNVDWSECCNHVIATDNYGHSMDHVTETLLYPNEVFRKIEINYDCEERSKNFGNDVLTWLQHHLMPLVSIKIDFDDIAANPLYSEFIGLRNFEVGDYIDAYFEDYGISFSNLRVVSKNYDVLAMETKSMEIGNFRPCVTRNDLYNDSITVV